MSAPAIVWIDERVARGLPQEKDAELAERGVDQIRYVAQDRVNDLVNAARGSAEFIVQISKRENEHELERLVALTNFGRLYIETVGGWTALELPEFDS